MAFSFTVEDGTGLPSAKSYVSVEEADDFLATNIHASAAWDALSADTREKVLSWASRVLDDRLRWLGRPSTTTGALRWPRTGTSDRDGTPIPGNVIPRALKAATAELARFLVAEDRTAERDQDALTRLKADVVELEFVEGYRLKTIPASVTAMLTGLAVTGGRVCR